MTGRRAVRVRKQRIGQTGCRFSVQNISSLKIRQPSVSNGRHCSYRCIFTDRCRYRRTSMFTIHNRTDRYGRLMPTIHVHPGPATGIVHFTPCPVGPSCQTGLQLSVIYFMRLFIFFSFVFFINF